MAERPAAQRAGALGGRPRRLCSRRCREPAAHIRHRIPEPPARGAARQRGRPPPGAHVTSCEQHWRQQLKQESAGGPLIRPGSSAGQAAAWRGASSHTSMCGSHICTAAQSGTALSASCAGSLSCTGRWGLMHSRSSVRGVTLLRFLLGGMQNVHTAYQCTFGCLGVPSFQQTFETPAP
jgi:hypothetical protein